MWDWGICIVGFLASKNGGITTQTRISFYFPLGSEDFEGLLRLHLLCFMGVFFTDWGGTLVCSSGYALLNSFIPHPIKEATIGKAERWRWILVGAPTFIKSLTADPNLNSFFSFDANLGWYLDETFPCYKYMVLIRSRGNACLKREEPVSAGR